MAKQLAIAGTERPKNKDVEAAADVYVTERNKRMRMTVKEKSAKVTLIALMREHKLNTYRDDDHSPPLLVTLSSKDDVKVTEVGRDSDDDEGGDE